MIRTNQKLGTKLKALEPNFQQKLKDLLPHDMTKSIFALYEIAIRDEKTKLYSNYFFNTILEMELEKAKREEKLSLMMIDLDFLKKINDKYGHIKADKLLYRLARVLEERIRKYDVLARFGGDEFVLLLPKTDLEQAKKLSKRLQNAIKKDDFLQKHGITISGGITEFKKKDTKKTFLDRVDKALYKSKQGGRDQFNIA